MLCVLTAAAPKPASSEWVRGPGREDKLGLLQWLLDGCASGGDCEPYQYRHVEYEGFDGWYNNYAHPQLGAAGKPAYTYRPLGWAPPVS